MANLQDGAEPPRSFRRSLMYLGPGIILASSIVGSGELIATTTVGAEAGLSLLWLVILGCAIKVAAQIEIGRNTITWGRTPLDAFSRVPGPRLAGLGWIYWCWALMTLLIVVQQGGVLAGAAQSLAGGLPLTTAGRSWNRIRDEAAAKAVAEAVARRRGDLIEAAAQRGHREILETEARGMAQPPDEMVWGALIAVVTAALLSVGRYGLIEKTSLLLVGVFTLVTLGTLLVLIFDPAWGMTWGDLIGGLIPSVPPVVDGRSPLVTGLATFGIIGVGASELIMYPYWCLEKGYGRAVGPHDPSDAWAERARGWLGVMQLDAWASMIVYTTVTVAFYLLGAITLGRLGLRPEGGEMIRTLSVMYVPVFGPWSSTVFLIGSFAVLYSTLFVAAAGNARMVVDGLILARLLPSDDASRAAWNRRVSAAWVLLAFVLAAAIRAPVAMVLASGIAQSVMLTALGVAVLYFRYREIDPRLRPTPAWDLLLWFSALGFGIVGCWTLWEKFLTRLM
jgi:Mn2+/Fe2+ NRAMP family transporter